jgi:hypothetical protein
MSFLTLSQGGGIKLWQYKQDTPASTWSIYHAFGKKPLIDIFVHDNGILTKAFPLSVIHIDDNNVEINWTSPRAGLVSFATSML